MFVAPATRFYPNDKQSNMASRINRAGGVGVWGCGGSRVGPEKAQQYQEKQKLRSHSEPTRLTPPPLKHLSKQDASFFPPSSSSQPTTPAGSSFMRAHRNRRTRLTVLQPPMWNAREREGTELRCGSISGCAPPSLCKVSVLCPAAHPNQLHVVLIRV